MTGSLLIVLVPQQLAKAQQPVEDDTDQAKKSLGSQGTASFVGMMLNSPAAQGHEDRAGLGFSSQADPYHTASTDPQFWMSALSAGGTVNAHADQATGLSFHENTGYMAGVGQHVAKGLKLGAFAGFSSQEESSEGETSHYKTENNFAGLRAEFRHQGWFADLSLTSGTIDFDNSREIPDITDTDIAVSSYRGLYAMPSVTIGHTLRFGGLVFEPSASFDYTHMQFDGFTETGTENALHGEARELGIWQTRGQLALATGNKAEGFLTARAGVELKGYTGEKFEGHINGLILQNVPDLPADSLTTYFGGTYVRDITDAWSLYGDMEWQQGAGEEEDNFEAKARLKMDF